MRIGSLLMVRSSYGPDKRSLDPECNLFCKNLDISIVCILAPARERRARRLFPDVRPFGERRDKPACCRGCKSPTGKENSESILASSLAGYIARCEPKRRQRYQWAGLLSFEKPKEQDADSIPRGGRQHGRRANASGCSVLRSLRTRAR